MYEQFVFLISSYHSIVENTNRYYRSYQMTTQLRSQVHQDPTQTSINLEQGAMDQREDWQAKLAKGERCCLELTYLHDSTVRELHQQIQMLSQDRDAYKQELELMSMNF